MGFRGKLRGWHITFGDAGENPNCRLKPQTRMACRCLLEQTFMRVQRAETPTTFILLPISLSTIHLSKTCQN